MNDEYVYSDSIHRSSKNETHTILSIFYDLLLMCLELITRNIT